MSELPTATAETLRVVRDAEPTPREDVIRAPFRYGTPVGGRERFVRSPWPRGGSSCLHRRTRGQHDGTIHREPATSNTPAWSAKCINYDCRHRGADGVEYRTRLVLQQ